MDFKSLFICFLILVVKSNTYAQSSQIVTIDTAYNPAIASITFHPLGQKLDLPIINLNSRRPLVLSFDDHRGGFVDLKYKVVHCDAEWVPSDLNPFEYIDGFVEERLRNFEFSLNTYEEYSNYMLVFPNDSMDIRLSGNYILHVFEDNFEQTPVLTRRFLAVENIFGVRPILKTPTISSKYRTHHEFDVTVTFKDIRVVNPLREISLTILQNGRWDNAITGLPPQSVRGEELYYDYIDKIIFPAGKEFRFFDVRNTRFRTESIKNVMELNNGIDIYLHEEKSRVTLQYQNYIDANGRWIVENRERRNERSESEYMLIHFTLMSEKLPGKDVYIVGGLTDWKLNPRFKMDYDIDQKSYVAAVMLKQGYYDYYYGVTSDGYHFDTEMFEGNWSETNNEYLFLVYFKPFGERYDRLAGISSVTTGRQ